VEVRYATKFRRDIKRITRQKKDLSVLDDVITTLAIPEQLDKSFDNHSLSGNWEGYDECHLTSDWLLIYCYETSDDGDPILALARTGSHSELFQ
jgi:mRNA interferase YafQ